MTRSPAPTAPKRRLTDIATGASALGVDPRTIRRWIADGRLPGYRVGGKLLRVDMADIDALVTPVTSTKVAS
ncbi:helix-turn-helix domain-containing protein [Microlunatus antarcticus]|uniref:Excisionase family DNA binding protein n=1 Tax=Microlunatus antarcticus TaxID=53388 RepID=A0A7W5JW85_9ACTN|nr:excisionase family DNA binding protein [Microlunatus antarcticus]